MFNDHSDHKNVCFIFDGSGKDCVSVAVSLLAHPGYLLSAEDSSLYCNLLALVNQYLK